MQPFNYNIQPANPFGAQAEGMQIGLAQRDAQMKMAAQQQAMEQARVQKEALNSLLSNPNPTAQDYARATVLVPGLREQLKQSWEMQSADQQQSALRDGGQAYSAIASGRPEIAVDLLRKRAEAMESSGVPKREVEQTRTMADLLEQNPAFGRTMLGTYLSSIPGGDKLITSATAAAQEGRTAEMFPDVAKKAAADAKVAESDATIKGEQAKLAPQNALLDLEKKGWDIKKVQEDIAIAKQNSRIAAMNASIAREGNDLKRQELSLKVDEAVRKRDEAVRDKAATAEAGAANIDNMLNTVQRILKNKSLNDVLGTMEGRMPAVFSDEAADAIALIDTLGSQAFLAQIPNIKGMGALSNAEGEKLQSALQNLSRTQSETQFRANLNEASRLLMKGRENLSRSTGVPLPRPDTPAAPGARPPLSSFQK